MAGKEKAGKVKSSLATGKKRGAVVRSADSGRMAGLAKIPTVKRREHAVQLLIKRAK